MKLLSFLLGAPAVVAGAKLYAQCGGVGYSGSRDCPRGAACVQQNQFLGKLVKLLEKPNGILTSCSAVSSGETNDDYLACAVTNRSHDGCPEK